MNLEEKILQQKAFAALPVQLQQLYRNSPIVCAGIKAYLYGTLEYTQALEQIVIALGEENTELQKHLIKILAHSSPTIIQMETK